MLPLVRANSPYTVLILAILTLLLKLQAMAHPVLPAADAQHLVFGLVFSVLSLVFGKSAIAFSLFAALMIFLQGIYLRTIAGRHRLFGGHTYLPAFAYITLSALHPAMGQFSAVIVANWLLLGALDAMLGFGSREVQRGGIFNAGFLLGCVALVHFTAIILVLALPLALLRLRSFRLSEWVVAIIGWLTPFYFGIALMYLFDALPLVKFWPQWSRRLPQGFVVDAYTVGLFVCLFWLLAAGAFLLLRASAKMTVSLRRSWTVLAWALCLAVVAIAFSVGSSPALWGLSLPLLALFVVPPLLEESPRHRGRSRRFATFTFYLLLALVVFCQLAQHG